jgi:hypothetical protein
VSVRAPQRESVAEVQRETEKQGDRFIERHWQSDREELKDVKMGRYRFTYKDRKFVRK